MRDTFQPAVYIIAGRPRALTYIGVTSNLVQRIWQHPQGTGSAYARRYRMNRLMHFELFGTMELAILREKQIKAWHRPSKHGLIGSALLARTCSACCNQPGRKGRSAMKTYLNLLAVATIAATTSSVPAGAALSYCSAPMAPSMYLRKPMRPFCAASRDCSASEVGLYRSEVERYFRSLRRYAQEVDAFYTDSATYIECMSHLD